ncbi:hypothetical protein RNAN_3300 [Rheinheimera nanhaiensis E407-8]|uniref:Uncharacterized protein n=1 Tax=Rheinheimera nanhaiensis E407-8 TaxID=562729 RepID=I1E1V0_9GAMM|nr:hypothetical protein RNAN_3300 [Rheinheimera nanhaiensis E407-8]
MRSLGFLAEFNLNRARADQSGNVTILYSPCCVTTGCCYFYYLGQRQIARSHNNAP